MQIRAESSITPNNHNLKMIYNCYKGASTQQMSIVRHSVIDNKCRGFVICLRSNLNYLHNQSDPPKF